MTPRAPGEGRTVRLDQALVDRGLIDSRTRARALILAGRVRSRESVLDKPGRRISPDEPLEVDDRPRDVGRGAAKLRGVLERLDVDVRGRVVLDIGSSTGGFTQVALEAGARAVLALDVGRGQLDWGLRQDPRVVPLEGINARHLRPEQLPERPAIALIDVSFISLRLILPPVGACLPERADIVMLVKPQFEVGRRAVGKGGIVRDPGLHADAIRGVVHCALDLGWSVRDVAPSPVVGARGNVEFFVHLARGEATASGSDPWEERIDRAVRTAHDEETDR